MATVLDGLDRLLEEDLSGGVQDSLPGLDTLWKTLFTTAMGVERNGLGRDFKVIHTFQEGVSGAIKWVPIGGTSTTFTSLDQGGSTHFQATHATAAFPGLDEHASPGHVQKIITLAKAMGNVLIPHEWIRAGRLSAAIADASSEIIRGAAMNVAQAEINSWYTMGPGTASAGALAQVATEPTFANVRGTNDKATFVVKNGSIRNFYVGMVVQFYRSNGTTKVSEQCIVDSVTYLPNESTDTGGYGKITVVSAAAAAENLSTLDTTGIDPDDIIVRYGSLAGGATSYAPLGPEQWLISSGTAFNINVATYPQFQSIVKAVNDVLSETQLNRYFGRFFQAYGMMNMPDTIVTSMGVTNAHVENSVGFGRMDRTNSPFLIADGWDFGAVPFQFNGMKMRWHVSPLMPSTSSMTAATQNGGRLWAMKLRDQNIRRYVAPMLPQSTSMAPFPAEVEFMYPQKNTIFKPYHDTNGRTTEFQEAPFYKHCAFAPKFMPGIKLTGLTENL